MASDQELNFSIHAEVPKENLQVLDTVLSELFGTLSSNMKRAGEFLENVKMRPPQENKTDKEETESESEGEILEDSGEESDEESDEEGYLESESDCDCHYCEREARGGYDCDADDEEDDIDHIFLVSIDGETIGYSTTFRKSMDTLNEKCEEFLANYQGFFRVQRTTTSVQVFRRTPYLWFLFSEQPAFEGEIRVVTKV